MRTELLDARDRPIYTGDGWLLDDRGKVYKALDTEETIRKQQIVSAQLLRNGRPVGDPVFLRCPQIFFVDTLSQDERGNRALYQSLYTQFVRPRKRAELQSRKRKISHLYDV